MLQVNGHRSLETDGGLHLIIHERTRDNAVPLSADPLGSKHSP